MHISAIGPGRGTPPYPVISLIELPRTPCPNTVYDRKSSLEYDVSITQVLLYMMVYAFSVSERRRISKRSRVFESYSDFGARLTIAPAIIVSTFGEIQVMNL